MNLEDRFAEMRRFADAHPFVPILDDIHVFRRDAVILGYPVILHLTRTLIPAVPVFYQLSIGNSTGRPSQIPEAVVQLVRRALVPNGMEMPSTLGNCRQFMEIIE